MSTSDTTPESVHSSEGLCLEPERDDFAEWLEANRRRMHCGHFNDEDCMRAAWSAAVAAERERWRSACETISHDLRNHDMVRLGAAKCIDRALKA